MNPTRQSIFHFKQFSLSNSRSAMKVGTDGVLLGAWAKLPDDKGVKRVLDVGCGTGLIALMIAQRFSDAVIKCIDISNDAVEECRENINNSPFASRVEVSLSDYRTFADGQKYDLIVSNPPFFTEQLQSPDMLRAVARHEDSLPLSTLFCRSSSQLAHGGRLAMVLPATRDEDVMFEATLNGLNPVRKCSVYSRENKPAIRTLWEFSKGNNDTFEKTRLLIQNSDGNYTEEYVALVKDFYLNF